MLFRSGGGSIKRDEVLSGENFENCCKHHEILRGENLDMGPSNNISFLGTWKNMRWWKMDKIWFGPSHEYPKTVLTGYPLYLDKHLQEQLFLAIYIYLYDLWRLCTSPLNQGFLQGYSTLWWILAMGLADLLWIADLHCRKVSKYQMVKTQTESHDWRSINWTNLWQILVSFSFEVCWGMAGICYRGLWGFSEALYWWVSHNHD